MDFMFYPMGFVESLKYMGLGLLGTFLIIGIIIGVTMGFNYASNKITARLAEAKDEGEQDEQ